PEGHKIPGYLTARQALGIFGKMSGLDDVTIKRRSLELLEKLRIAQWIDVRVKKHSKGMTQRLGLAIALLHAPHVLLLDEPVDDALVASFRESGAGVERVNGHMLLTVDDVAHLNALVDKLRAGGGLLTEISPVRSTLEDVFVDLVRAVDPGAQQSEGARL